jgi:hypothetical protein
LAPLRASVTSATNVSTASSANQGAIFSNIAQQRLTLVQQVSTALLNQISPAASNRLLQIADGMQPNN